MNGQAALPDIEFENGIIEFDIMVSEGFSFSEVTWRVQVPGDYEEFYFRPHLSGQPVLAVDEMERQVTSGSVGLKSNRTVTRFANFNVTSLDKPALLGTPEEPHRG